MIDIKGIRISRNITQKQAAEIAEISQSYFADIENRNKAIGDDLPVKTAKGIAKALGIVWWVLYEDVQENSTINTS